MMDKIVSYNNVVVFKNGSARFGSILAKALDRMTPDSKLILTDHSGSYAMKLKDVDMLMVKVPNRKQFNFYWRGGFYSSDLKDYEEFEQGYKLIKLMNEGE